MFKAYKGLPKEVYVIFVSRIVNALGSFVGTVMTFILVGKIGFSETQAGAFLTFSMFTSGLFALLGGKLSDVFGRKKVMIVFDVLGLGSYYTCSFIQPDMVMVLFMFLSGQFYAAAGPSHDSLLADYSTSQNRKQVYSLSYLGWNLGYALGPAVGGFLYRTHLWLVFFGDASTTLISVLLILFLVKEKQAKYDSGSRLEQPETGSVIRVLLRRPTLILFALIIMGFNFIYSQWGFLLQLNMMKLFPENGAKYYGTMASLNGLTVILFTAFLTTLFINTRPFKVIVFGGLMYCIAFGLLGFYPVVFPGVSSILIFFFACIFIFTLGEIMLTVSVNPYIFNHTPSSHRGRMSGTLGIIMGTGYMLGPWLSGMFLNRFGFLTSWKAVSLLAVLFAFCMFLLGKLDKPIKEINVRNNLH